MKKRPPAELTPVQVLAIASAIQAQRRARQSRLSGVQRFRRWGGR